MARRGGANEEGGKRALSPGNGLEVTFLTRSKGTHVSIVLGVLFPFLFVFIFCFLYSLNLLLFCLFLFLFLLEYS